jgi:hypothetical protein
MKRFLLFALVILCLGLGTSSFAQDVIPVRPIVNTVNTIGLYQVTNDVTVYKEPNEKSQILCRVRWNNDEFFPEGIGFDKFFAVFLGKKQLALVNVVDITEDWVEIVYNNKTGATGWIKQDDPYKFMTWTNFYYNYGRKYGLVLLKSAPDFCKDLKSTTDDKSQTVSTMNYPQTIILNVIRGNWALVSVLDLDKTPKTGYVRWRSDDGIRYFFPNLK